MKYSVVVRIENDTQISFGVDAETKEDVLREALKEVTQKHDVSEINVLFENGVLYLNCKRVNK